MSVLSDLAFQLLDQGLQLGDEGDFFGDDRLFMLAGTLDRQLELCGLERLGAEPVHKCRGQTYPVVCVECGSGSRSGKQLVEAVFGSPAAMASSVDFR